MDARYFFLTCLISLIGIASSENEAEVVEDLETDEREPRAWPWGRRDNFVCPSLFGTFADITDCSAFYICVGGISNRKRCSARLQFDKYRKVCLPFIIAVCDKGDGDDTTKRPTTKGDRDITTKGTFTCLSMNGKHPYPDDCSKYYSCTFFITSVKTCPKSELFDADKKECKSAKKVKCGTRPKPKGDNDDTTKQPTTKDDGGETTKDKFSCPSIIGNFPHPDDCSKYYSCTFYVSTLKTCPKSELFDGIKKQCKPAKDVNCGTRQKPTDETTQEITTPPISTETPNEPETPTEPATEPTEPATEPTEPATEPTEPATEPTEPNTTPVQPETSTPTEPEPVTTTTTEEPTTTPKPKATAPDTECDEDDVDCIIDDLGETPDWFVCPDDLGSYPHPSSKKLFIFCLNWKPFVKKCGQDLVFSEDLMTCTHP